MKKPVPAEASFIANLMARMKSREDNVSFDAHAEARQLKDLSLLPEIEAALQRAKTQWDFPNLAYIVSHLIANTGSSEPVQLYETLLEKTPAKRNDVDFVIHAAEVACIPHCRGYALSYLNHPILDVRSSVVSYLGKLGGHEFADEDIKTIGAILDDDPDDAHLQFMAVLALTDLCRPSCIPYLERFLERHKKSRKSSVIDAWIEAKLCLAMLGKPKRSWDKYTQLTFSRAITIGNIGRAQACIDSGADVNSDLEGFPPLCAAANSGKAEIAKFLLDKGADVDAVTAHGRSALMIASSRGATDLVDLFCRRGADVDYQTSEGKTALMEACESGNVEVVRLLLKNGASVDLRTEPKETSGTSALMFAARSGNSEIIELLVGEGACVSDEDGYGLTALTHAHDCGQEAAEKTLVKLGADISKAKMTADDIDPGITNLLRKTLAFMNLFAKGGRGQS